MATPEEKLAAVRGASGNTIARMTEFAGLRSPNTFQDREKEPMQFRICELKGIYDGVNEIGKNLIREALDDIFLPV